MKKNPKPISNRLLELGIKSEKKLSIFCLNLKKTRKRKDATIGAAGMLLALITSVAVVALMTGIDINLKTINIYI
jgi:hypothetical protein